MADRSYTFLKGFFKTDVDLALLVLNPEDWNKRQPTIPYGTPFADLGAVHFRSRYRKACHQGLRTNVYKLFK